MKPKYIVVQAGGRGSRLEYLTNNKPKALVPVGNLPMIFHLFRKYPESIFIIIGDYKYDVLEKYLDIFAEIDYRMVDASGTQGTCSGLKKALSYIPENEQLMLIWSDLLLDVNFSLPQYNKNYIGISKTFYCRWSYNCGEFKEIKSNEHGVAGLFIFKNKNEIKNVPYEGEFVRWLATQDISFNEVALNNSKEIGLLLEYEKIPKSKCRPFNSITIDDDKIIKKGINSQGESLAIRECAWYKKVKELNISNIPHIYQTSPLVMEKIEGKNMYECQFSYERKCRILNSLIECLLNLHKMGKIESSKDSYYEAYIGKTYDRLEKVKTLIPFADKESFVVNGKKCINPFFVRSRLEEIIMHYFPKEFVFLHGDCTFSNLMIKDGDIPVMIDPRGYFGTTELYGDAAYDWAKLYYSIVGNYDQFNLKRFKLLINENDVTLNIESNGWEEMEPVFFDFIKEKVNQKQIKVIHAIIWLSLTTYAWEDYDSICGAFYNGSFLLTQVMEEIESAGIL